MAKPKKIKKRTKQQMVEEYIINYGSITSLEAINQFYVTRLSAVIYDLKKDGWVFDTTREKHSQTGTSFARYHLKSIPAGYGKI